MTIAVPLKYISNFCKSLEIPLINCKVELKLRWKKYCVLSVGGTDNVKSNDDGNHIIFTIKDATLCVPVVTLSTRDNQKLSKFLRKEFERSVYWSEDKIKSGNNNTTNEFRYFRVNRVVFIQMEILLKELELTGSSYWKEFLIIITSSSMEKALMIDQFIQI